MVVLYGVGFQFAWGTIPWIYPAELFSMSEKGLLESFMDLFRGNVFGWSLRGTSPAKFGNLGGIPSPLLIPSAEVNPNIFQPPERKRRTPLRGSAVSLAVGVNYVANALVVYVTPSFMSWSTVGTLRLGSDVFL